MSTAFEIAFITSPDVTMATPLGRTILAVAAKRARWERERIHNNILRIEANKAIERERAEMRRLGEENYNVN